MKKLFALLILITTALEGYSQTDTICVPRKDLVRKLIQLENLKVDSLEGAQAKAENKHLLSQVVVKEEMINGLNARVQTLLTQIDVLKVQKINDQNTLREREQSILSLQKDLRKQKRKHIVTKAVGIVVIGGLTYLLFTQ